MCIGGLFPYPGCILYGSEENKDDDDDEEWSSYTFTFTCTVHLA
jgi:hypothetical protein